MTNSFFKFFTGKDNNVLVYIWPKQKLNREEENLLFKFCSIVDEKGVSVISDIGYEHFHFHRYIGAYELITTSKKCKDLKSLPFVSDIFIAPSEFLRDFYKLVHAFEDFLSQGRFVYIDVLNLSLEPFVAYKYSENDPINVGTKKITSLGVTIVMAAGNYGLQGENSLSTWVYAPWVISVGASDVNGDYLADFSSIGSHKGSSFTGPTVVAAGINIISDWPIHLIKDEERLRRDLELITTESIFAQNGETIFVDNDYFYSHTVESGTSQAAPTIAGVSGILIMLRKHLHLDYRPAIIKEILKEIARPMLDYKPHEVGAGFVNKKITMSYLENLDSGNLNSQYWPRNCNLIDILNKNTNPINIAIMDDGFSDN